MTTDLYLKTCLHDEAYHVCCEASIRKFCTGFRNVIVEHGEHPQGYVFQQCCKLSIFERSDADHFLITDSDTIFRQPVTPETYFRNGKPTWIISPWDAEMRAHEGLMTWYRFMTDLFGQEPPAEFMRRQPFLVPRWLMESFASFVWKKFGRKVTELPLDLGKFSEFNALGFHAWLHHRGEIEWIDTSKEELPPPTVFQAWSHDSIEKNLPEILRILVP